MLHPETEAGQQMSMSQWVWWLRNVTVSGMREDRNPEQWFKPVCGCISERQTNFSKKRGHRGQPLLPPETQALLVLWEVWRKILIYSETGTVNQQPKVAARKSSSVIGNPHWGDTIYSEIFFVLSSCVLLAWSTFFGIIILDLTDRLVYAKGSS